MADRGDTKIPQILDCKAREYIAVDIIFAKRRLVLF